MLTSFSRRSFGAVAALIFLPIAFAIPESHVSTAVGPRPSGQGVVYVCNNRDGPFAPFCKPENGSTVYVGETYHITWDPTYYAETQGVNSTVLIMATYLNASGQVAPAHSSPITPNRSGFIRWTVTGDWLQDFSSNNVTLSIVPLNAAEGTDDGMARGPTVMVTSSPIPLPESSGGSSHRALVIALPVAIGITLMILCVVIGIYIHRKHGLRSIIGRKAGYGVGKSRSQRIGKEDGNAIQLREQAMQAEGIQKQPKL